MLKIDHMMIRTPSIDKSTYFYTEIIGMELLYLDDRSNNETNKYITMYFGFDESFKIEVTYNLGIDVAYEKGNMFDHIAFNTDDSDSLVESLNQNEIEYREFTHHHNGTSRRMLSFLSPEGAKMVVVHKGYES